MSSLTGTLSFLTYYLLKNPDVMRKLHNEIDEVIGQEQPQYVHLSKLPYLTGEIHPTFYLKGGSEKHFSYTTRDFASSTTCGVPRSHCI
jgi:hypothetical protein